MTHTTTTNNIKKFLSQFPDNATSWAQATDEIRDLARTAKEYYNEMDLDLLSEEAEEKGQKALDFTALKTPAAWNTEGKKYIMEVYNKMSSTTKLEFYERFIGWFE